MQMTDQSSIKYISSVLDGKYTPKDGDSSRLGSLRQSYPYFVPVRYMEASAGYGHGGFSPAMLTAIQPYLGDWLVFCDLLQAPGGKLRPVADKAPEPLKEEVSKQPAAPVMPARAVETQAPDVIVLPVTAAVSIEEAIIAEEIVAENIVLSVDETIVTEVIIEKPSADDLVAPLSATDYFQDKGEKAGDTINELKTDEDAGEAAKSLMVMMSFAEWLLHFRSAAEKQQEETRGQKALRTMWQKEKLAAAMEEENEEIPEKVFEMAVNSISMEEGLASETLADIYAKQGKYDQAIEMYRKLSLRNPQKSAYFARKIEEVLKDKRS